jgi:hypothetical protein
MTVESPAGLALAERMAARREPGPASFRLLTTSVCVESGVALATCGCVDTGTPQPIGAATAGPAPKVTAAETPASKAAAPAIRGMHRPARLIRLFMKTICMAWGNILFINRASFLRFFAVGIPSLKYSQLGTR